MVDFGQARSLAILAACALLPGNIAIGQAPAAGGANVSWTVATPVVVNKGRQATIVLRGAVRDGWHVYALKQRDGGPTPLRVTLDADGLASAAGQIGGSAPVTAFEPAFGFETPYYARDFTMTVPVKLSAKALAAGQPIAVNVRFQTCNGRICEPPKTIRLSAPLAGAA